MTDRYIVGQTKDKVRVMVMQQARIGDVDVWVEFLPADSAEQAHQVATALNLPDRNPAGTVADDVLVEPLYGGVGQGDVRDGIQRFWDLGYPDMAYALAEAHGIDFEPEQVHDEDDNEQAEGGES